MASAAVTFWSMASATTPPPELSTRMRGWVRLNSATSDSTAFLAVSF